MIDRGEISTDSCVSFYKLATEIAEYKYKILTLQKGYPRGFKIVE